MPSLSAFEYGGTRITFSRGHLPARRGLDLLQPSAESTGADAFYLDPRVKQTPVRLRWPRMPLVDVERLETFFRTTVNGMARSFTWYDLNGAARTVRFASPRFGVREIAPDTFEVDVDLLEA